MEMDQARGWRVKKSNVGKIVRKEPQRSGPNIASDNAGRAQPALALFLQNQADMSSDYVRGRLFALRGRTLVLAGFTARWLLRSTARRFGGRVRLVERLQENVMKSRFCVGECWTY